MSRFEVDSAELDQLGRSIHAAGVKLTDLEPANTEAGRVVEAAAHPPRRSGALAASLRADATANGVTFASSARYWTFVHYGAPRRNMRAHPWWSQAVEASRTDVLAVYAKHATHALDEIG